MPHTTDEDALKPLTDRFVLLSGHMREAYRLWELWAIAARDRPLLDRLGKSVATQGFIEIRNSLHRSLVLTLARMWDKRPDSLSIQRLIADIGSDPVKSILTVRRTQARDFTHELKLANPEISEEALATLARDIAAKIPGIIADLDGEVETLTTAHKTVDASVPSTNIRTLRNKRIAHHDLGGIEAGQTAKIGDEQRLLDETGDLIQKLGGLLGIDPNFEPMRRSARIAAILFWAPVRAETLAERRGAMDATREPEPLIEFYRSSNGDRWILINDGGQVRHEPNLASGGQVSEIGVDEFLARSGSSPQAGALREMLKD